MTKIPDEINVEEFKKMQRQGIIGTNKKGKLQFNELLPEYKSMLEKQESLKTPKSDVKTDKVISGKSNKKVKNAKKCEYKGIKFDSKLELNFYRYLELNNIKCGCQVKYELQEGFKLDGKKIQAITWTPDFVFDGFIVDTKGFLTPASNLRIKMFKFKYRIPVYLFRTAKEFNKIHNLLK